MKLNCFKEIAVFCELHCKPIPVMKTGFSLCSLSHREKPVFITWEPCNENGFFPVWKNYTGKTLFWPCTGPVQDCSVTFLIFEISVFKVREHLYYFRNNFLLLF
jgi:hypothetical protein